MLKKEDKKLADVWAEHGERAFNSYTAPDRKKISQSPDNIHQWLLEVKNPKNKKLLDVGCGIGQYVTDARILGFNAEGIDISPKAVEIGMQRGEKIKLGDMRKMPYKNETFDVVIAGGSMEHFPETSKGISESSRVLKKEGILLGNVPNRYTIFVLTKHIQQLLGIWKCGYEKSFTTEYFKSLLEKNGFRVLEMKRAKMVAGKHKILGNIIKALDYPLWLLGFGGPHFYFKCIKK